MLEAMGQFYRQYKAGLYQLLSAALALLCVGLLLADAKDREKLENGDTLEQRVAQAVESAVRQEVRHALDGRLQVVTVTPSPEDYPVVADTDDWICHRKECSLLPDEENLLYFMDAAQAELNCCTPCPYCWLETDHVTAAWGRGKGLE